MRLLHRRFGNLDGSILGYGSVNGAALLNPLLAALVPRPFFSNAEIQDKTEGETDEDETNGQASKAKTKDDERARVAINWQRTLCRRCYSRLA